jgi:hypothetical protein
MIAQMRLGGPGVRVTPEAAAGLVGTRVPVNLHWDDPHVHVIGRGWVTAAEVVDDGAALLVTVDVDTYPPVPVSAPTSCWLSW